MITSYPEIDAESTAHELLGRSCTAVARIGGGRNSRVYRVDTADGPFALKLYFRHGQDRSDRRATEFSALTFLRSHGVCSVPEPLATNAELSASLFSFAPGNTAQSGNATREEIEALADFLVVLHQLSTHADAQDLPLAAEAMFSLEALAANINSRRQRLSDVKVATSMHASLTSFLQDQFGPVFRQTTEWAADVLKRTGANARRELSQAARTLSPSDFGFHNVLKTDNGGLTFVDFEYFGWDDPAKMLSDFLLHPGMALTRSLRGQFLQRVLAGFGDALDVRLRVVYPLYALKWCMILLNEFVPEHLERRLFANPGLRPTEVQRQQLDKAQSMLALARSACDRFPYEEWMPQ